MDVTQVVDQAMAIIVLAAAAGIVLLLPLYLSQRRDLRRLLEWMEREPEHAHADAAASEVILDRAEVELERLTGEHPVVPIVAEPSGAAARVTSERPALERVTIERTALLPHPRWRRFRDRVTQPRWMAAIGVSAVALAVAGIFGSQALLQTGDERGPIGGRIDTEGVQVAVLNGTTVAGLGDKVGDDVTANDFALGSVTTFPEPTESTVVLFEPGSEGAARRLSAKLGSVPVQPIDRRAQKLAEGASVVVIVGQDRALADADPGG